MLAPQLACSVALAMPFAVLSDLFVNQSANCSVGDGTELTPFCTVTEALAVAADGDVIHIAPGVYGETVTADVDVTMIGTAGRDVTIMDGLASGSVITVPGDVILTIDGLTLQNGRGRGGGITDYGTLTMRNSTIRDSQGSSPFGFGSAGGITQLSQSGPLTLRNCTISGNRAGSYYYAGGGIRSVFGGDVTIVDCEFVDNRSNYASALSLGATRALISGSTFTGNDSVYGWTIATAGADFTMVNSTITENQSGGLGVYGSTIPAGTSEVIGCTIAYNDLPLLSAGYGPNGLLNLTASPLIVTSTVVAGNVAAGTPRDAGGTFQSGGHNLIGVGGLQTSFQNGVLGDQVGTLAAPLMPTLGPLQDNGGVTRTRALLPGSPAIGLGDPATTLATDQRGLPRSLGANDIGAVRYSFGQLDQLCDAVPNSTGRPADIFATGSPFAMDNDLVLTMASMPTQSFGFFLISAGQGNFPQPGGASDGTLCLAQNLGRLIGPGQVRSSGPAGFISVVIDLNNIPPGVGSMTNTPPGTTWHFQGWHRDPVGLGSNFSSAVGFTFL